MPVPYDLADPVLAQFLRERIRRDRSFTYEGLAARATSMFGARNAPGDTTLNKWVDVPTLITKDKAQKLLQVTELEAEWERFSAGLDSRFRISGAFDYESRERGLIRELDLTAVRAADIDPLQVAADLVEIDIGLFAGMGSADSIGTIDNWHKVIVAYPDTWRVFVDEGGRVLGYWLFVHPRRDVFLEACFGNYPEDQITPDTLCELTSQPVNMYGPGMYVRAEIAKEWEQKVLGANIQLSFLYNLRRLESENIHLSEICCPVYSAFGQKIVEKFELQAMPEHVSERYAKHMRWERRTTSGVTLPAVYHGFIDPDLRRRAGLVGA